jgi:hypothetical protein
MNFKKVSNYSLWLLSSLVIAGCASTPEESSTTTTIEKSPVKETVKEKPAAAKQETVGSDSVDVPGNKYNVPSTTALGQYANIEIAPVTMTSSNADSKAGKRARRSIDGELRNSLPALYQEWKSKGNVPTKSTLLVKADVPQIKIVPPGARFWGGAFAGRSNIIIKVTLIDKETNQVIATPEFYRHSNAFAAAWSGGAADRDIVQRAVDLVLDYFESNEKTPTQTPTGR